MVELAGEGREALVERVWGPVVEHKTGNRPAAALMLIGGLTVGMSAIALNGFGLLVGLGSLATGGVTRLARIGRHHEARRENLICEPAGEADYGPRTPRVVGGTVVSDEVCIAPMSARHCVAYTAELRDAWAVDTYLRDAVTIGFTIESNDGRQVEVPPGPLLLTGGRSRPIQLESQVLPYLCDCDREWRPHRYDPFPYLVALEAVLCRGDSVELLTPVEPILEGNETDYRHTALARMRPIGLPRIHILSYERKKPGVPEDARPILER